jgi:hypothetical protein
MDRRRGGEQHRRAGRPREQQRPGGAGALQDVVAARERDRRGRRAAHDGGDQAGVQCVAHAAESTLDGCPSLD